MGPHEDGENEFWREAERVGLWDKRLLHENRRIHADVTATNGFLSDLFAGFPCINWLRHRISIEKADENVLRVPYLGQHRVTNTYYK